MIKKMLNKGISKRAISKKLCISRETVRKYASLDYKTSKRNYICNFINPYMQTIEHMISISKEQHSDIPISAIYDEIKSMGYKGTLRWLQKFIKARGLKNKENKKEPMVRFETSAGWQMQVDWIEFKEHNLSAFVATLGYSRASYVEYVMDKNIQTLIKCHINAFNYFGGVSRECLYDNMKTVILSRNFYGHKKHKFNPLFEDFAKHCGFKIRVCRPYRAKTKGKVERFNRYLRYSFHNVTIVKFQIKNYPLTDTNHLFQIISRRYEKGSIIFTSNLVFSEWENLSINSNKVMSAILDRVIHHSHIVNILGNSYRAKEKREEGLLGLDIYKSGKKKLDTISKVD